MFKRLAISIAAAVILGFAAYDIHLHAEEPVTFGAPAKGVGIANDPTWDKPIGPVNPIARPGRITNDDLRASHGTGVGRPSPTGAAGQESIEDLNFCIDLSRVAYEMAKAIAEHGYDRTEMLRHLSYTALNPNEQETPEMHVKRVKFLMALVQDVFVANDYVLNELVGKTLPGGIEPVTREQHPALVSQIILEGCGYQYGKDTKQRLEEQIRNTPRTSN